MCAAEMPAKNDPVSAETLVLCVCFALTRLGGLFGGLSCRGPVWEDFAFDPNRQGIDEDESRDDNKPFILKFIRDLPDTKDRKVSSRKG